MKKNKLKQLNKCLLVGFLVSAMTVTPVFATPSSDELKQEQAEKKEEAKELTSRLNVILAKISSLKSDIENTQKDLEKAGLELDEAELAEYEQYEAMKLRIRYMYEESTSNEMVEKIMQSKSIVDMLNQAEYVNDVHTYDRDMLDKYIEAKEAVVEKHEAFEKKLEELDETQAEVEKQQDSLSKLLKDKEDEIQQLDSDIAEAIAAEEAERERLRLEAEAAARAAEEARIAAEAAAAAEAERLAALNNANQNTTTETPKATGSATGSNIVNYAMQFIGNKYVYGGTSLTGGIDCSGFTMRVYQQFGYSLPRTSAAQRSAGVGVSYSDAQPGDLICYAGHVAIYIGGGQIVHASNSAAYPKGGIKTSPATYTTIVAVRRIL